MKNFLVLFLTLIAFSAQSAQTRSIFCPLNKYYDKTSFKIYLDMKMAVIGVENRYSKFPEPISIFSEIEIETDNSDPFFTNFIIKYWTGELIMEGKVNFKGKDGTSDKNYPIEATLYVFEGKAIKVGCETDKIKTR